MPDGGFTVPTLADLMDRLAADESLSATRRRDLVSAVRRFCRLVGRDPATLPARVGELRPALERINPVQAGLSTKSFQNLKSDLLAALRAGGGISARTALARDPVWSALAAALPEKRLRDGLSRFLRYCADEGIAPQAVGDETVGAFISWVEASTFVPKPRALHRQTCRLWNEAGDRVPDWPQRRLTVPDFRAPRQTLRLEDLPSSLRREAEAWLGWLADPDPFDEDRPRKALAPRTVFLRRQQLLAAVTALVRRGYKLQDLTALADIAAAATVKDILRHYLARNARTSDAYLQGLAQMLFGLAKDWVRVDEDHLSALRGIKSKLAPLPTGLTPKNRAMLRQFRDPRNRQRLLGLPDELAGEARYLREPARAALRLQLALAVEFLLMAPLRMANLVSLDLERHLTRPGGVDTPYHLVIPAAETKNDEAIEFVLPEGLTELIDRYCRDFRPALAQPDNPFLFPDRKRGHKAQGTLSQQITEAIAKRTGLTMTCHQFRHLAAYLFLERSPGQFVVVQRLLAHKSLKTTMSFYADFSSQAAAEHYDTFLTGERARLAALPARRGRAGP